MTTARHIDTVEAKKLLLTVLKRRYPGVKFQGKTRRFAGGSSIDIYWVDGPAQREVDAIAQAFGGRRFDGSNDSTYFVDTWLLPNGEAIVATRDRDGYRQGQTIEAPEPGAELVSFTSFMSVHRELSDAYVAKAEKVWVKLPSQQACDLLNHVDFPRWAERSDGYKLAWFFDAKHFAI